MPATGRDLAHEVEGTASLGGRSLGLNVTLKGHLQTHGCRRSVIVPLVKRRRRNDAESILGSITPHRRTGHVAPFGQPVEQGCVGGIICGRGVIKGHIRTFGCLRADPVGRQLSRDAPAVNVGGRRVKIGVAMGNDFLATDADTPARALGLAGKGKADMWPQAIYLGLCRSFLLLGNLF